MTDQRPPERHPDPWGADAIDAAIDDYERQNPIERAYDLAGRASAIIDKVVHHVDNPIIGSAHEEPPPTDAVFGPIEAGTDGIEDPTKIPGVHELPAVQTNFTPEQFRAWVDSDGEMFMVMLPAGRSFVIKVPTDYNAFFVSMMQQFRFTLGPEVQAIRMNLVTGPPADVNAPPPATGTAAEAPEWAKPPAPPAGPPYCSGSSCLGLNVQRMSSGQPWRGECPQCGRVYRLTYDGRVRAHRQKVARS